MGNNAELLEVAQNEEKKIRKLNYKKVKDIFITLKSQEWPNMVETCIGVSVQKRSNFTPELCCSISGFAGTAVGVRRS